MDFEVLTAILWRYRSDTESWFVKLLMKFLVNMVAARCNGASFRTFVTKRKPQNLRSSDDAEAKRPSNIRG